MGGGLEGDYPTAAAHLDRALALFRELGESWTCAQVLHLLGEIAQRTGDLPHAGRCYRESLLLAHQMGDKAAVALVLQDRSARLPVPKATMTMLPACLLLQAHTSGGRDLVLHTWPALRMGRKASPRSAPAWATSLFAACWAQGQAMALPQAVEFAGAAGVSGPQR